MSDVATVNPESEISESDTEINTLLTKARGILSRIMKPFINAVRRWKRQFKSPDIEVLTGVVLGSSWGRLFAATYLGALAFYMGLWTSAAIIALWVGFEAWQGYHLANHFNAVLTAEIALLSAEEAYRTSHA